MGRKQTLDPSMLGELVKGPVKEEQQELPEIEVPQVQRLERKRKRNKVQYVSGPDGGTYTATRVDWEKKQRRVLIRISNEDLADALEAYAQEHGGLNKTVIKAIEEFLDRNT